MDVKTDRAHRAATTRRALLRHAHLLFAEQGYAHTSTQEIVAKAGVTKGALYHHFDDKLELYRAVVESAERELIERVESAASQHEDPWARLESMCQAYLEATLDPGVTRILVLEAPLVLGWKTWCEIGEEHEIAAFAGCLRDVAAAGLIREGSPHTTAQVLLGALNTAARLIATATDTKAARTQAEGTIERLLAGLRVPAGPP